MSEPATLTLQQAYEIACAHHAAGRFREAESLFRQILAHQPNHPDALHMLGLLAHQAGHQADALKLIGRAIELNPNVGAYHGHLGLVHRALGQFDEELKAYRTAVALRPDVPAAHYNLGVALEELKRFDEAMAEYRRALELSPDFPEAHNNLGHALREAGRLEEATAAHRRALELRPSFPEALNNLGFALQEQDQLDEAIATYQRALALHNDYPEALNNLGNALRMAGRLDEATDVLRRALELRPGFPDALWNLSLVLLLKDHTAEGWQAYEARRQLPRRFILHDFPQPEWEGGDIAGKRLLIHAEQGFGDIIQMARYLPLLAERGATVLLECQSELKRLMEGVSGVTQVIPRGDLLPAFDLHCPLMSLPGRFHTTTATIPASVPYIHVDRTLVEHWRQKLSQVEGLKVGLIWAGRPTPRNRSIPPELLAPLANVPGVRFFSLQPPQVESPAVKLPPLDVIDLSPELSDFVDTAAALQNLDLLITIDTAGAHLAGALGRPTWVLLQFAADWRWFAERSDSPWYPTLRLFRQPKPGDWETPIARVANELRAAVSRDPGPR